MQILSGRQDEAPGAGAFYGLQSHPLVAEFRLLRRATGTADAHRPAKRFDIK